MSVSNAFSDRKISRRSAARTSLAVAPRRGYFGHQSDRADPARPERATARIMARCRTKSA